MAGCVVTNSLNMEVFLYRRAKTSQATAEIIYTLESNLKNVVYQDDLKISNYSDGVRKDASNKTKQRGCWLQSKFIIFIINN